MMKCFIAILVVFSIIVISQQDEIDVPELASRNFNPRRGLACGGISRAKHINILSPSQPPKECVYRIQPSSAFVCQLRIDFDAVLAQPTPTGTPAIPSCERDEFTVGTFKFCGTARNQHIYVPFNITRVNLRTTLPITFKVADRFADSNLGFFSWNLRIQQLECPSGAARSLPSFQSLSDNINPMSNVEPLNPFTMTRAIFRDGFLLAPNGCLQYYPQTEGIIESFNYNTNRGPYLPNQDYAICFRKRAEDTKLVLTFEEFSLDTIADAEPGYNNNCLNPTRTDNQSEDYLFVPFSVVSNAAATRATQFCGNTARTLEVTSTQPGPFLIYFHSDGKFTAAKELGFRIQYKIE